MDATLPSSAPKTSAGSLTQIARDVWSLGKPRLSSLVIFTAGGGLYLAGGTPSFSTILAGVLGTAMVVAGANALNNYIERESDLLMERTRNRPLPTGRLAPWVALVYGLGLAAIAMPWLYIATTPLASGLAFTAFLLYVLVYTPLKRRTWLCVVVGGVAGAIPPLIGWTAVTGSLDPGGLALFAVLFLWQLPHSLAITIYRKEEYANAGLKILPIEFNDAVTRQHIMAYSVGLVGMTLWLVKLGLGGILTFSAAVALGAVLLAKAYKGLKNQGDAAWARDLFLYTLVYLSGLFIVMAIDHAL